MTIVNPPKKSYPLYSVTSDRRIAMTAEMLNGFGATETSEDVETTYIKAKVPWEIVIPLAIVGAILIPLLLNAASAPAPQPAPARGRKLAGMRRSRRRSRR